MGPARSCISFWILLGSFTFGHIVDWKQESLENALLIVAQKIQAHCPKNSNELYSVEHVEPAFLKRGDVISFERYYGAYRHVGIVADDAAEHIYEFNGEILFKDSLTYSPDPMIVKSKLADVRGADNDPIWRHVYYGKTKSVDDVIRFCKDQLGKKPGYNVILFNCEHWAHQAKLGQPISGQVNEHFASLKKAVVHRDISFWKCSLAKLAYTAARNILITYLQQTQ